MKNKTYILNTFLTAVLGIYLLVAVIVRTFCPQIILPKANIPNMVLVSLIALVLDHYLAPDAKRCYICIPVFSAIAFGLLPYTAAFCTPVEAVKLAVVGGVVFTVTTSPLPLSVQRVFPFRPVLFLMTALAASRMCWVER